MNTLSSFLEESIQRYGAKPVILYTNGLHTRQWSYIELGEKVRVVANWLEAQGIGKGDRVVLWAANSPWWVATYFATLQLGAILVPLDVRGSQDFACRVISQAEPTLAILSEQNLKNWDTVVPSRLIEELENLPEDNKPMQPCPAQSDDIALLMFTSGTTGDPKGVILTHRNILANVESTNSFIPFLPNYRLLSVLPLSHMLEQTVGLLQPIKQGASVFYPGSLQPTTLFRSLKEQQITTMVVVQHIIHLFMNAIEKEVKNQGKESLWKIMMALAHFMPMKARHLLFRQVHQNMGGKLHFFAAGGAYLDPELVRKWNLLGVRVVQGYGLTEAAPVVTGTIPHQPPDSVGKPLPGVEVKLSEDGEILVRGANITPGYWRNPQTTKKAFIDGWLRSGDLGFFDEKGFLYLRGRKKDLIVLANGLNVYPEDVERALKQTPGIVEAAVVAYPQEPEPQVYAVIQCEAEVTDPRALITQVNKTLAPYQRIKGFTVWAEADFPRTHTLKIKKNEVVRLLKEQHQAGWVAASLSPSPTIKTNSERLLQLVADVVDNSAIRLTPEMTLEEAGLDSLSRVELLAAIEEGLGVYLDETQVQSQTSLQQLQTLLEIGSEATIPEPPDWPLAWPARAIRPVLQLPAFGLLKLVAPVKVYNREIFDGLEVPLLLVANHTSHLDTLAILKALPKKWRNRVAVAAAEDYFFSKPWLAIGVGLLANAFPFSRTSSIRSTMKHAAWLIDQGWSVLLYPEGTRTTDGKLHSFKAGVGLLAAELEVAILPVKVEGLFEILPKGQKLPKRGYATVKFGQPLCFSKKDSYYETAAALEEAMRVL